MAFEHDDRTPYGFIWFIIASGDAGFLPPPGSRKILQKPYSQTAIVDHPLFCPGPSVIHMVSYVSMQFQHTVDGNYLATKNHVIS